VPYGIYFISSAINDAMNYFMIMPCYDVMILYNDDMRLMLYLQISQDVLWMLLIHAQLCYALDAICS
jgi:hypothetical protein